MTKYAILKKVTINTDIFVDIVDSRREIYCRLLRKGKQVRTKCVGLMTQTKLGNSEHFIRL
jgi:hypothetical protein